MNEMVCCGLHFHLWINWLIIKEKESNWSWFWFSLSLFFAEHGGWATAPNPQRKNKAKPTNSLRISKRNSIQRWLSMPSRVEWNCFVCFFGLPRSCGLLGAAFHSFQQTTGSGRAPFHNCFHQLFHFSLPLLFVFIHSTHFLCLQLHSIHSQLIFFLFSLICGALWRCCAHNPPQKEKRKSIILEWVALPPFIVHFILNTGGAASPVNFNSFSISFLILQEKRNGMNEIEWAAAGIKVSVQQQQLTPFQRCFHFVNFMLYSPQLLYPCTVIILF